MTAVTVNRMKIPYKCPYCIQFCTRRWNLGVHIERKHKGGVNPYKQKNIIFNDSITYNVKSGARTSDSIFPEFSDPSDIVEKTMQFKMMSEWIRRLSRFELLVLRKQINDRFMNFNFRS